MILPANLPSHVTALIGLVLSWLIIQLYFVIARKYGLVDVPNHRSSHSKPTIVGAGIIFFIAFLADFLLFGSHMWFLLAGSFLIGIISFVDDRMEVSSTIRLPIHGTAVVLMLLQLEIIPVYFWLYALLIAIVVIGTMNAYNFMDGINGITGIYSLVILGTLLYCSFENSHVSLMLFELAALLVFLFYNYRKKAVCFSGDIGSVTIAYVIVFLLLDHFIRSNRWETILLVAVYGVDSVTTILTRLMRRENIFQAHRSHIYQHLVHSAKWSHRKTSAVYGLIQLVIALVYIGLEKSNATVVVVVTLGVFTVLTITSVILRKQLDRESLVHS